MKKLLLALFLAVPVYADINVTEGSGKTVKTDSISSKEYQYIKIIDGTAGSTTAGVVDSSGNFKVNISSFLVTPNVTATNTSFGATQATDSNLNASVSIKGSSNTVVLGAGAATIGAISNSGFNVNNTPAVTQSGGPWTVYQTNPSTATITGSVTIVSTGVPITTSVPLTVVSTGIPITTSVALTVVSTGIPITGSISNTSFNEYQTNPSTSQLRVLDLSGNPVNVGWAASTSSPVPVAIVGTSSQPAITVISTGIPVTTSSPLTVVSTGIPVTTSSPLTVVSTGIPVTSLSALTVVSTGVPISGNVNVFKVNNSTDLIRVLDLSGNGVNVGWASAVSSPVPVALINSSSQPVITVVSTGIPVTTSSPLTIVSTGVPVTSLSALTVVSTGIPITGNVNIFKVNNSTDLIRVLDLSGNGINVGWAAATSSPVPVALVNTSSQPTITVVSTGIPVTTSSPLTVVSTGIPVTTSSPLTVVSTGIPVTTSSPLTVVSTGIVAPIQVLNMSGSPASVGFQATITSVPVVVEGFGKIGGDVYDSANNAVRMNVVAGGGAGGGTSSALPGTVPSAGTAALFSGPGNTQMARVDSSSNVWVTPAFSTVTASQGGTYTVTPGTGAWNVTGSTVGFVAAASSSIMIGSITAQGFVPSGGNPASGNPFQHGVKVTSTTIPTAVADGLAIYGAGSNIGQTLVTGIPGGLVLYSTATLSGTTETVFISSAGANTFNYLCGCIVTNTSATNSALILRQSGGPGSANNTNQLYIGSPSNYVPAGIWPGCTNPFYRSSPNSNITITEAVSVSSLEVRCQYYTGP